MFNFVTVNVTVDKNKCNTANGVFAWFTEFCSRCYRCYAFFLYIYIFFYIEKIFFSEKNIFFKTYKIRKFICNNCYTTYLSHLQVLQQPLQSVTFTVTKRYNRYKSSWSSETKIKFLNFCELRFYL